jgi:hypothetical protein
MTPMIRSLQIHGHINHARRLFDKVNPPYICDAFKMISAAQTLARIVEVLVFDMIFSKDVNSLNPKLPFQGGWFCLHVCPPPR